MKCKDVLVVLEGVMNLYVMFRPFFCNFMFRMMIERQCTEEEEKQFAFKQKQEQDQRLKQLVHNIAISLLRKIAFSKVTYKL